MGNKSYWLSIITTLLISLWVTPLYGANASPSYSFGVVPQQSAKRLAQLWGPVLLYLSQDSGIKLRFKTAKNIPEFEKKMAAGEYHFAYMNPYHFTVFNTEPGYRALAVRKNQPIKGIIVVHKDSPIQSLKDLQNTTLAFPSPAAFAASVLPREQLSRDNITFKKKYVSSHDSVYLNVAKGLFAAGGGVKRTLNNTKPNIKSQLKILWHSAPYTPHAVAAHTSINHDISDRIQQSLIRMSQDPKGKKLLESLKIKHGLIAAKDSDWDDVRAMGVDLLDKLIRE